MEKTVEKPLKGVLACFSGIDRNEKDKLHGLVEQLGGRYSRELHPERVTHLIVLNPSGLKYETAIQYPDKITIVSPAWIERCAKDQEWVDEGKFMFPNDIGRKLKSLLTITKDQERHIFSKIFFHLIGWDVTDQDFKSITTLIRRCWGTILWDESDEAITHFIAKDGVLNESLRGEIGKREGVYVLSPLWVISSCAAGFMAETIRYPAICSSCTEATQQTKVDDTIIR